MNFHILTLFPEMVMGGLSTSITGRAMKQGKLNIEAIDIRDFSKDKNRRVDDYTYGGGAGMLMQAQPIYDCYRAVCENIYKANPEVSGKKIRTVYLTPQAKVFNQGMAMEMSDEEDIIFLCGHYEGVDERVLEEIVTDYISIGDYVLTGGELPALILMDAISRMVPGVLGNDESAKTESFDDGLLEYPQYSRPEEWMGKRVPDVLLSGHHANIEKWRRTQSELRTKERRPDLYEKYLATKETV